MLSSLQPDSPQRIQRPAPHRACAARSILDRIGDKWSFVIILVLADGAIRFGQLRLRIDDISQRMLTATLPNLRPSVEYSLTTLGHSLLGAMRVLEQWARTTQAEVQAARASYDGTIDSACSSVTFEHRSNVRHSETFD
jgi:DNA-binding HxlR family transcriptional regulator